MRSNFLVIRACVLGVCGSLSTAAAGCDRRTTPEASVAEMFPGIDSATALTRDTTLRAASLSRDSLWQDFDRPYVAYIASKYRVMLWLCSRDRVRLVFYSNIKPDWPPPGRQFAIVSYQLYPDSVRTDTFRLHDGNWMQREVNHPDLSRLDQATDLRVHYMARATWPSAGDWHLVLTDSARAVLTAWSNSCAHGPW
jgi:hypothetical protein